jgi:crotonobetainyl-CoA:carnitine CoA-transferase CaiB-like acyl-CoA transferase
MADALEGILITEIGGRTATGVCGSLLAQFGATVVYIDGHDSPIGRKGHHREQFAAGKSSFAPDLADDEDRTLLRRLLAASDVVLVSSDVDDPALCRDGDGGAGRILCDITAFGRSGALAGQAYSEALVQALSGIADTTGMPEGLPVPIGVPIVDFLAGTYAAGAVIAALRARRLHGIGQAIDVALFDCAFVTLHSFLSSVLANKSSNTSRLGNNHPTVAPWNLYKSSDGWILICAGNQAQWERLCDLIDRPDFKADYASQALRVRNRAIIDAGIEAWTSQLSTEEGVRRISEAMVACGPIAPIDVYPREANLVHRRMVRELFDPVKQAIAYVPGSPLRMSRSPGRSPEHIPAVDQHRVDIERLIARPPQEARESAPVDRPLAGVRVIEIGQYTTAPLCARHLAHLGADVIKVEQPGGDESRTWMPHIAGRSVSFRINNSDKRSLTLDLKSDDGRQALERLIASADILLENMKPGALARLGFPADRIAKLNPRLVYGAITGFGSDSLYANRPAFDMVIQAMSGFMTAVASGDKPLKSGISTADTMGAVISIASLLAALEYRDRTGEGQYIDLSMQDVSTWLTQTAWNEPASQRPLVLECGDGCIVVEAERAQAFSALGLADSRSGPLPMTRDEACRKLRPAHSCAPVLSVTESAHLAHTRDRALWFTIHQDGVDWPMLTSPMRLEKTPPRVTHLAPSVNQHGADILRELGARSPTTTTGTPT